jgi:hypothetical protein
MKKTILSLLIAIAATFCYSQTTTTSLVKSIVIQPEIKVNIIAFEIMSTTDNPGNKTVISNVNLIAADGQKYDKSGIIVWQGQAYDDAGQWTDTDLKNAIKTILNQ